MIQGNLICELFLVTIRFLYLFECNVFTLFVLVAILCLVIFLRQNSSFAIDFVFLWLTLYLNIHIQLADCNYSLPLTVLTSCVA